MKLMISLAFNIALLIILVPLFIYLIIGTIYVVGWLIYLIHPLPLGMLRSIGNILKWTYKNKWKIIGILILGKILAGAIRGDFK